MFTKDMIAPCGLDCSICKRALAESGRCAGCRGPNDNKPEFCSERCGIILCEKRKANGYSFCDECPDFPCADVIHITCFFLSLFTFHFSLFTFHFLQVSPDG